VARVSFEVARRHRFTRDMATFPDGVEAHVLPAAGTSSRDDSLLSHRDFSGVQARIDATYAASRDFLDAELGRP
jgi:NTE family protein